MDLAKHWQLNPDIDFLNHGSFGATPTCVLQAQRRLIDAMEADPIRFIAPERELEPKLDAVRELLAKIVEAPASDIAFVRNATDGVNAVFRSVAWRAGDEILVTNHGYNACINAARFAAERAGAEVHVVPIPFPIQGPDQVVDAIEAAFSQRTRLLMVDHVTSPTGLVFPIEEIIRRAHARGIRVLVDGAHAPGMLPLTLEAWDADYYTANHHKWLCGPKVSGFLYVRPELQEEIRPTVISHAANRPRPGRSRFLAEFDWTGTFDPTPLLALPAAVEFLASLFPGGLAALMHRNHQLAQDSQRLLCDALQIRLPAPASMLGSLVTIPVPHMPADFLRTPEELAAWLYREHRLEMPVFLSPCGDGTTLLRIALQAYNRLEQVERLAGILRGSR